MGKEKWLSIEQKKVYQYLTALHFNAGDNHASETAYNEVIAMSEMEVHLKAQAIANGGHPEPPRKVENHHRIGVISDTHIGSIYAPAEWLDKAFDTMAAEGCEMVLHCGDLTEGMKGARIDTQMYEIEPDCLGYPAMREAAVKACERCKLPMYIISGNHDHFFPNNADIVADVCMRVPTMHYLGSGCKECHPVLFDGAKVLLFHGLDGFSNVRLKNLAFSEQVGLKGISMVLAGHVHKFEVKFIDGCYMIHVPTLQATSGWMRGKKLYADCGFLILDFEVKDNRITNLTTKYVNL